MTESKTHQAALTAEPTTVRAYRIDFGLLDPWIEYADTEAAALLRAYRECGYGPEDVWLTDDGQIDASIHWQEDHGDPGDGVTATPVIVMTWEDWLLPSIACLDDAVVLAARLAPMAAERARADDISVWIDDAEADDRRAFLAALVAGVARLDTDADAGEAPEVPASRYWEALAQEAASAGDTAGYVVAMAAAEGGPDAIRAGLEIWPVPEASK